MPMKKMKAFISSYLTGRKEAFVSLTIKDKILTVLYYIFTIVLAFVFVLYNSFNFTPDHSSGSDFVSGKKAERDFKFETDFIYVNQEMTEARKQKAYDSAAPVFVFKKNENQKIVEKFNAFGDFLLELKDDKLTDDIFASTVGNRLDSSKRKFLTEKRLNYLNTLSREQLKQLVDSASLILKCSIGGVLFDEPDFAKNFNTDGVNVYRKNNGSLETEVIDVSLFSGGSNLSDVVRKCLDSSSVSFSDTEYVYLLARAFVGPNTFYDENETLKVRKAAMQDVVEEKVKFTAGTLLVKKDEIVDDNDITIIDAYNKKNSNTATLLNILGLILAILMLVLIVKVLFRKPFLNKNLVLSDKIIILFSAYLVVVPSLMISHYGSPAQWLPPVYILPSVIGVLIITILISSNCAIFFIIITALADLVFLDVSNVFFMFLIYSGVLAAVISDKAESPERLIKVSVKIIGAAVIFVIIIGLFEKMQFLQIALLSGIVVLNIFASVLISMGFVHFFEQILNLATPFRLMELSNTSSTIFKQMITLAPGTYSHSMNVAHLAESACREIGANGLLARVGSYYHDIGKLDQAEFFVENQDKFNKHDEMRPELSVAVIKSHVKKGVEKAVALKLPQPVIDIIEQHHGNGVILYFYTRAINDLEKDKSKILRDDYRYKTPLPQTKEAAVVMLADCVEAASRTMKDPTISQLEKFVWKIITDKFDKSQLSCTDLTFKDLEAIKNVFMRILVGNLHSRIEYPEEEKHE
jgi:putative nucleotidyltransferase with HDIG domain